MAKSKKTPQNKVGDRIPTDAELQQAREQVQALTTLATALGPALSKDERKRITKPRKGAEPTADLLLSLAQKYNVTSRLISVEAAQRDRALYEAIGVLTQETFAAWKNLRDVYVQARGEHWEAVLYFYGVLGQMAKNDPEIAQQLEPATAFFALSPQDSDDKDSDDDTGDALE